MRALRECGHGVPRYQRTKEGLAEGRRAAGGMGAQAPSAGRSDPHARGRDPGGEDWPRDGGGLGRRASHAREVHGPIAVIGIPAVAGEAMRGVPADDSHHREARNDREEALTADRAARAHELFLQRVAARRCDVHPAQARFATIITLGRSQSAGAT
jgi:hypothetical protein